MITASANELTKQVLMLASRVGARLWRRNVGQGWIGNAKKYTQRETVIVNPGDVVIRAARPFHNGEAGQYDTWGWQAVTITPEMVGTIMAQHIEIEIKFGADRLSTEQQNWGAFCATQGVRAGVARTVDDAARIIG